MKVTLIGLILLNLFSISCRTKAEGVEVNSNSNETPEAKVEVSPTPTPELKSKDINSKIGIVDGYIGNICFRTKNGNLAENTPVSIVTELYEPSQKVLNAKIEKRLKEACSRRSSESGDKNPGENFYYSLTLAGKEIDEYQEVFGFGVIESAKPIKVQDKLASVDLNEDGKPEFFRLCQSFEGMLFAIWTGKPLKGKRIWDSFYYVDYDTVITCTKKD